MSCELNDMEMKYANLGTNKRGSRCSELKKKRVFITQLLRHNKEKYRLVFAYSQARDRAEGGIRCLPRALGMVLVLGLLY
jgi:hypothetical protein